MFPTPPIIELGIIFYLSGPALWPAKTDADICLDFEELILSSITEVRFKY